MNKIGLSFIEESVLPFHPAMKKVILVLLLLIIVLPIVAVVAGLLYANHYVQSPDFKQRLVSEISKVTGGTVQIDTINVSLSSRIEVGGVKLDRKDATAGSQAFSTKEFIVKFNPWGLLRKQIEITELSLISPDIKIVSAPKPAAPPPAGPGQPPAAPPDTAGTPSAPSTPQPTQPQTTGQPPAQPTAPATPAPAPAGKPAIDLVIRKASVRDGKLDITLPNGKRVLLESFNLESVFQSTTEPIRFNGHATCGQVTFDAQPPITQLDANFRFDNNTLFIEKARGTLLRGAVEAEGQARIDGNQPFNLRIKASDIDLKAVLEKKPDLAQAVEGTASANVTLEGVFTSPLDAAGKGSTHVKGGKVNTTQLKQQIAQIPLGVLIKSVIWAIQLPELETLVLNTCETEFTIGGQKVNFSRIDAEAEHVKIKSTGVYGFDQTINFDVHSAISQQIRGKLPPLVSTVFTPDPDQFYGFDFRVFGTVDKPENDAMERATTRIGPENINALIGSIESLVPQGVINNTFDQLEGMIKGAPPADPNAPAGEKKPGLLDSIFGAPKDAPPPTPPPDGSAAPAPAPDGSTNAPPKKGVLDRIEKLF